MVTSILHHLSAKFSNLTAYKSLKQKVDNGKVYITGLNQVGKLLVLAQIRQDIDKKIIYIVKNASEQAAIKQDLEQLLDTPIFTYPDLKSERINRKE